MSSERRVPIFRPNQKSPTPTPTPAPSAPGAIPAVFLPPHSHFSPRQSRNRYVPMSWTLRFFISAPAFAFPAGCDVVTLLFYVSQESCLYPRQSTIANVVAQCCARGASSYPSLVLLVLTLAGLTWLRCLLLVDERPG